MAQISGFLDELAADAGLADRFSTDPEGVMTEKGLTPEQQATIKSGSLSAIRDAIQEEVGEGIRVFMIKF